MLDLVSVLLIIHKYGYQEHFPTCIQITQGILHVGASCLMSYFKGTWGIRIEK